ncbi:hypothetical protein ZWY2020_017114 [Hordeum vulgare]|nr:hypothetical protein ZWY2020_017114 [Hordeum vulgare]
MDVHLYFAVTLANLAFGRSLSIKIVIKPEAEHSPDDGINVPATESLTLMDVTFSVSMTAVQIRVVVLAEVTRPPDGQHGAMVLVLIVAGFVTGAATAAAIGSLVTARRENTHDN